MNELFDLFERVFEDQHVADHLDAAVKAIRHVLIFINSFKEIKQRIHPQKEFHGSALLRFREDRLY